MHAMDRSLSAQHRARPDSSVGREVFFHAPLLTVLFFAASACGPEAPEPTAVGPLVETAISSDAPIAESVSRRGEAGRDSARSRKRAGIEALKDRVLAERANRPREFDPALEAEWLEQLDDPDPEVRADAVWSLSVDEPDDAAEERRARVISLLATDSDPRVRAAAAERLGEIHSSDSIAALVRSLSDPEQEVVLASIEALEEAGDTAVIPDLEALLDNPDEEIRDAAEFAISFLQ
jgi:HEAT repeat protein